MRMVALESLGQAGFEVVGAESGLEAVNKLNEIEPDLVLLDVNMPHMDGFATCRALKASAPGSQIPVIMVTALDDVDSVRKSYEVGATDFVTKPLNWLILRHRIDYVLRANRAAAELRKSRGRLANAQRIARLGYWEWQVEQDRLSCSAEMCRILGSRPANLSGSFDDLMSRVHPEDQTGLAEYFREILGFGDPGGIEYRIVGSDGKQRHVEQQSEVAARKGGRVETVSATVRDISERKDAEATIRFLRYNEATTGLPNRRSFVERLDAVLEGREKAGDQWAVLVLGLDRFDRLSDTLGPGAGDELLRHVAYRLRNHLRSGMSNWGESRAADIISHFGSDEFAILLADIREAQDVSIVARRLLSLLDTPLTLGDHQVFVKASLGVAVYPNDGATGEDLVSRAQAARHHAQPGAPHAYHFYDETLNESALERLKLESNLAAAIERDEFDLFYQPQVDMTSGQVLGVEALIRWNHPELGLLTPFHFLDLAEETGQIVPIGEWVLREACRQARLWRDLDLLPVRVSVNLSSRQLLQEDLADKVAGILEETDMPPHLLNLELTEGALMQDFDEAAKRLTDLKGLGVGLSVDDFGKEYSSLSRLAQFPLDCLKIDKSFLRGVPDSRDMSAIVGAIIAMGESLGLEVLAEGVELEDQVDFLIERGCTRCQGFLFAKPMSAEDVAPLLEASGASSSRRAESSGPVRLAAVL